MTQCKGVPCTFFDGDDMCSACAERRAVASLSLVAAASQGEAERGGEAVAWRFKPARRLYPTHIYDTAEEAALFRETLAASGDGDQWTETPLYARSAGEGTPSVTAETVAFFVDHFQGCADADVPHVNALLALLEGAQHTQEKR